MLVKSLKISLGMVAFGAHSGTALQISELAMYRVSVYSHEMTSGQRLPSEICAQLGLSAHLATGEGQLWSMGQRGE